MKKFLLGHGRKIGVIALNMFLGNFLFYRLIGIINKHTGKFKNIFMLYPANSRYSRAYVYQWYERQMKWKPRLVGVLWQNNKVGFVFGISATEKDLLKKENIGKLQSVVDKMESIRQVMGADQKSFAGIIPGLLFSQGIEKNPIEREITAKAVMLAVEEVVVREIAKREDVENVPVCIIGGNGFIGSSVREMINNSFSFDINDEVAFNDFVSERKGQPAIFVNLTKKGVLKKYLPKLWSGAVVINEVYPEPSQKEIEEMQKMSVVCYHIVGAEGGAFPAFPRGYAGGIPCCSSFWPEDDSYKVVVRKL